MFSGPSILVLWLPLNSQYRSRGDKPITKDHQSPFYTKIRTVPVILRKETKKKLPSRLRRDFAIFVQATSESPRCPAVAVSL